MREEKDRDKEAVAQEIVEHSPAIALRIIERNGVRETDFITENITQFGYSRADFLSGKVCWADIVHPDDRGELYYRLAVNARLRIDQFSLLYRIIAADDRIVWVNDIITVTRDIDGNIRYSDCIVSDYSVLKESQEKIEDNIHQQEVLNDILVSLHDADPDQSFKIILDRVGRYLGVSRILLFEDSPSRRVAEAVYEWCSQGTASLIEEERLVVDYKLDIPELTSDLDNRGMRVIDYGNVSEYVTKAFSCEDVCAMAIFAVYSNDHRRGFIRFDECVQERYWSRDTIAFLETISKLVSTAVMRRQNAEAVMTYQKAMETVLNNIPTYIYVVDPHTGDVIFANQAYRRDFSFDYLPQIVEESLHLRTTEYIRNLFEIIPENLHNRPHYFEIHMNTTQKWYGVQSSFIPWIDGRSMRLFSCQDISEKKRQEEYIQRIAYMDHLTGLPNRYRCDVDLQNAIETAGQSASIGYVLFIDMDDFKIVNDGYGHDYGDALLIEFSNFLRNFCKPGDNVFRFGGDEFVILIAPENAGEITKRLDMLIRRTRRPWIVIDKTFYCSISIGVVAFPDGGMGVKEFMKNADVAMYEAKKMGKGNYVFYTASMRNDSIERAELESMLRESISNNFEGMSVHYQPVINLSTGKIAGAEALIRWVTSDGKTVVPDSFIALAEYLGLIVPIGQFVLREALASLKCINEAGFPDFYVSVNLSIRQMQQQDIVSQIEAAIHESEVNPCNLLLEITEGLEMSGQQRLQVIIEELRKMGLRIAMDDFGTGYSSLSNLRDMAVDVIKIDRSFISNLDTDDYSRSFVTLITAFGHAIGKQICIEGVETHAQLEACRLADADNIQGYFFHRPMPKKELLGILTANN